MRLLAGIGSALLAPGRALALAVLVLLALLRTVDTAFLEEARLRGFDLEQRLYHRVLEPAEVRVRVVAIDEKSLRRYGQWPWPRTLVARLVRKIAAGDPRVLGVDIPVLRVGPSVAGTPRGIRAGYPVIDRARALPVAGQ